jgi:glycosyltransferase involved in cell wall biosynthesis
MLRRVRICIVYDCLYPYTVGGAERWYRDLAEGLAKAGHEITYLTLRQWEDEPDVPDVAVVETGPRMRLYTSSGRRRIGPPLRFGLGVLIHLLRHGRNYDVVHCSSFPYFPLQAVAVARPLGRYEIIVEWVEVWSTSYWLEYLGPIMGRVGWAVQRACARVRSRALCYSRLHAARLREEGFRGKLEVLPGLYVGPLEPEPERPAESLVTCAARLIPEKRVLSVVPAVALAAMQIPGLRGVIFGEGPERTTLLATIAAAASEVDITAPGFVERSELHATLRSSLCMLLPSRREGYGMIVVEAAACGVPSIVVRGPDNAAVELIEDGVNGVLAPSAEPADLAAAIVRVSELGERLRASTREWFIANAALISADASRQRVLELYSEVSARA